MHFYNEETKSVNTDRLKNTFYRHVSGLPLNKMSESNLTKYVDDFFKLNVMIPIANNEDVSFDETIQIMQGLRDCRKEILTEVLDRDDISHKGKLKIISYEQESTRSEWADDLQRVSNKNANFSLTLKNGDRVYEVRGTISATHNFGNQQHNIYEDPRFIESKDIQINSIESLSMDGSNVWLPEERKALEDKLNQCIIFDDKTSFALELKFKLPKEIPLHAVNIPSPESPGRNPSVSDNKVKPNIEPALKGF